MRSAFLVLLFAVGCHEPTPMEECERFVAEHYPEISKPRQQILACLRLYPNGGP